MDKQAILNAVSSIQKPSKADAFNTIKVMMEKGEASNENMAALFAFFMPTNTNPKNDFAWVALATKSTQYSREFTKYVFAASGYMYGSDGHRIHRAPTNLEDGVYCPKTGIRKTVEITPPPFADFFGEKREVAEFDLTEMVVETNHAPSGGMGYLLETGIALDGKYIKQALGKATKFTAAYNDLLSGLTINLEHRACVIMPYKFTSDV